MSATRTIAQQHLSAAFGAKRAGAPFSDATNRVFNDPAAQKPVSRREARQRHKEIGGGKVAREIRDVAVQVDLMAQKAPQAHPQESGCHWCHSTSAGYATAPEPAFTPAFYPGDAYYTAPPAPAPARRPTPTLIVRTLPGPPLKKYYGAFEACSRADLLVEETSTPEEDMWGIVYPPNSNFAACILGLIPVITHQAAPGMPGNVQIFYG